LLDAVECRDYGEQFSRLIGQVGEGRGGHNA
jgi:hypothetical protein